MDKMMLDDWRKKGRELFGRDPEEWAFKCPACGNVASVAEFVAIGKGILKGLVKKEFLVESSIDLLRTEGKHKKSIGKRSVVYYTPKGRAYVRKYIDETYVPVWLQKGN